MCKSRFYHKWTSGTVQEIYVFDENANVKIFTERRIS